MGLTRRDFGTGAATALGASLIAPGIAAAQATSSIGRIKHWVVAMMENRSFDSLLGHLPHVPNEDGIRDRTITLNYPGGSVALHKATHFWSPDPNPGEAWANVNVQLWNRYIPETNGRARLSQIAEYRSGTQHGSSASTPAPSRPIPPAARPSWRRCSSRTAGSGFRRG